MINFKTQFRSGTKIRGAYTFTSNSHSASFVLDRGFRGSESLQQQRTTLMQLFHSLHDLTRIELPLSNYLMYCLKKIFCLTIV